VQVSSSNLVDEREHLREVKTPRPRGHERIHNGSSSFLIRTIALLQFD
jgi:hypothetical protein